jgi:uncharacterized protein
MIWLWHSLYASAAMLWETLWALVLGFSLSACLQVFFRNEQIIEHFGKTNLRSVGLATFLGAVSSSCSFAAAATGKTIFKKGAGFVPTLAFMFASTNLVLELGLLLWLLLGWEFVLAEIIGAFVLIGVMWLLVKLTLPNGLVEQARAHESGEVKSCGGGCGHESETETLGETFREKLKRQENWQRVADAFVADVSMLWKEIAIGFLIAGFLMVLVPDDWWGKLFITQGSGFFRHAGNVIAGAVIGIASFTCSCGNIPLASVLWSGGISFGGVISFIYADLITLPLILIYRKHYGAKAAFYITAIMFISIVVAGSIVDLFFGTYGLIPKIHSINTIAQTSFKWNYTTWLNFVAITLCGWFVWIRNRQKISPIDAA